MELTTIKVSKEEAQAKIKAYYNRLRRRANLQYRQALDAYSKIPDGGELVDLGKVFLDVPLDEWWRPRVAVARADRKEVRVYRDTRWSRSAQATVYTNKVRFDTTIEWGTPWHRGDMVLHFDLRDEPKGEFKAGKALVPLVPPEHRPGGHLRNYTLLWEVERWQEIKDDPKASMDPYLLRQVFGDLYVIVAQWDLTEIEKAILEAGTS